MTRHLRQWRADEAGTVALEHVLLISLIVAACIYGATAVGLRVDAYFNSVINGLH